MKKLLIACFISNLFHSYLEARQLKDIILDEFTKVQKLSQINNIKIGRLIFSNQTGSHVGNNNLDIAISESEIESFTKDSSDEFVALFCRFVLTHELAHQIQFASYKNEVISKRQGEGVIFLECHADILAGLLMTQISNGVEIPELMEKDPKFDGVAYARKNGIVIFSVYKTIFEMDKENTAVRTHPNNAERLLSIRQGIILGNVIYYHFQLIALKGNSQGKSNAAVIKKIEFLFEHYSKGIGFDFANNPYMWAHDEAIRITHENNLLAKNLVLFNENIDWNTNSKNPIVKFSFDVLNRNKTAISFAGRVYTEIIPRNDNFNLVTIAPVDGLLFSKTIEPGKIVTIEGSLKWIADNKYMPNIIIPGSPRSMYWAFSSTNMVLDISDVKALKLQFDDYANNSIENIKDLFYSITKHDREFVSFIRGMGYSDVINVDEISSDKVFFETSFNESGKKNQKIYIDEKSSIIVYRCGLFHTKDSLIARKTFVKIRDMILNTFPKYKLKIIGVSDKPSIFEFLENDRTAIRLKIRYYVEDKTFNISTEIFGKL